MWAAHNADRKGSVEIKILSKILNRLLPVHRSGRLRGPWSYRISPQAPARLPMPFPAPASRESISYKITLTTTVAKIPDPAITRFWQTHSDLIVDLISYPINSLNTQVKLLFT